MSKGRTNSTVGGSSQGIPTSVCTNITATRGNGQATLIWTDPPASETVHGVEIIWKSTTVRYKAGSAPTSATDGTLVTTTTTRNKYSSSPLTISGLTNGTTYYISVFPKSEDGAVNTEASQIVSVTLKSTSVWTVVIDQSNSNPLSCCTYADDAVGMTKGSSEWDDIFGYKPCVLNSSGTVLGYLNPSNFAYYTSGSSAPITNSSCNVMIEFPKMGVKISTSGTTITVSLTDEEDASGYNYYAFTKSGTIKDQFYMGAYLAGSGLTSISGVSPVTNITLSTAIANAQSRGSGFDIMGFYQWTYIQVLYLLKYGNLNSQAALGKGYTGGSAKQTTGVCNARGMNYGNTSSSVDRVKLFGIEDMWGNVYQWLGGLYNDSSYNLITKTNSFNTNPSASSWDFSVAGGSSASSWGYIRTVQGTTNGGFIPKSTSGGSSTTYWSDYGGVASGYFPDVGGGWGNDDYAGLFYCDVIYSASYSYSDLGCRLQYL